MNSSLTYCLTDQKEVFWCNVFTKMGNVVAGPGTPFTIYFGGLGDLNYRPKPFVPNFPRGPLF